MDQVRAKIAGRSFMLIPRDVEEHVRSLLPEPLDDHYVVIAGKRFPPHQGREAASLRPFMGQWVAQRGLDVLVAADTPQEVLAWLERHNQRADVMFRVPRDEAEASGVGPI